MITKNLSLLLLASIGSAHVYSEEIVIPRSMADRGTYYLLEAHEKGGIIATLHKRVGVQETGYSRTEIKCRTKQYRDVAYGESGPSDLKAAGGKWTYVVAGSSKSDLVQFVCSRAR